MANIRVLLIDDDPSALNIMKDYLADVEHLQVSDFQDGKTALNALQNAPHGYDVLLLDWTLTPVGGSELLGKVKEINPTLPAIVFTGNAEAGAEAYARGAFAYFKKPVELEDLVRSIRSVVSKNRTAEDKSLELGNLNILLIEQQTLKQFADAIVSKASRLVDCDGGCFYLWNWKSHTFQELAHMGCSAGVDQPSLPEDILGEFISPQSDILVDNDEPRKLAGYFGSQMKSQAAVLLRRADLYLGLLVLGKMDGIFANEDTNALHALKAMVSPLLEQIKVRERLQGIQQKNYTTEDELCADAILTVYELLGKPAILWQVNRARTELTVCSSMGVPENYLTSTCIPLDDPFSLLASAIRGGMPMQTTADQPQSSELTAELQNVRSELAIPLFTFENAPIGVVTLFNEQANLFKDYDIQLVQNFLTQVARSIDTLRRQAQSQKLAELSETLVTQSLDENATFKLFAQTIHELTGADSVAIYPYDPQRHHFYRSRILAQEKDVQIMIGDKVLDKPRQKGLAYVVRYAGKIVVDDTLGGEDALHVEHLETIPGPPIFDKAFLEQIIREEKYIEREKIRSFIGISLRSSRSRVQDEVGVMYVNYHSSREFTSSEINLLQIAAGQVASLIQNRRTWVQQRIVSDALKEIIGVIGTTDPLTVILEQTARLFNADHGAISRITEDGLHVEHKAVWEAGKIMQKSKHLNSTQSLKEGVVGIVARTGITIRSGDVKGLEYYKQWYPGTKSELAVPLKNVFGGNIGVLNLESNDVNYFTEGDEKLCENFAHAASAAIQQAELFDAIQSLQPLTETHSLKELFDVILKNLNQMMGANTASSVNLYDAENDNFYAFYGVGPDQNFVDTYLLVPPRPNGTGRYVLKNKKPLYYDDVNKVEGNQPKIREESKRHKIVSFAVLPLIYRGELMGALFIHKIDEPTTFSEAAKRILETYATQAALAIHTAQHHIDIGPLKSILDTTVSANREEILHQIVEKAVDIMNSDYSSLWLKEASSNDLVRQAIHVRPGEEEKVDLEIRRISQTRPSVNMNVFASKQPRLINNVEKAKDYNRIYRNARSEIAVPLIYRNEVLGTLNTESQRLGAFSELDVRTLRVFADIAAIAIKIAQTRDELSSAASEIESQMKELQKRGEDLYQMNYRLERRNAGFQALTEISQQLTANIQRGEKEILSIIQQQASLIMDTNNMFVALYDPEKDMVHFELAYLDGIAVNINSDPGWKPRLGGKGRTEWIIRKKKPILTYSKAEAEKWYKQPDTKDYIQQTFASWLGVPILFGDQVLGVIATYHKTEEYKYGPDDLNILSLMGRQAAIALINARLVRQLDKRIMELDAIRELGEDLSQNAISM